MSSTKYTNKHAKKQKNVTHNLKNNLVEIQPYVTLMFAVNRQLKLVINMFGALEKSINIMKENKESQRGTKNYPKRVK